MILQKRYLGYAKVIGNNKHWGNCTQQSARALHAIHDDYSRLCALSFLRLADIITKFCTKLLSVLWKSKEENAI